MNISNSVKYIGVNDHDVDLFEGQYIVPNGMSYNSYVIIDEKIAVMDTVDQNFGEEWLKNLDKELDGRKPDYLVVQHMEPDHSANIAVFTDKYPDTIVVASSKAFTMMKNFFGTDYADRRLVVNEGDTLNLGEHVLNFVAAPMVHWPEVILSYESTEKILFSADAFGKFGALDVEEDWDCEARRYYIGIVGKYGAQVQALLKKASKLDIKMICPLHGPVLKENLEHYIGLYSVWASYEPEKRGTLIAYASVYGHTKEAAELLAEKLKEKGCKEVLLRDLCRCDIPEAVEDAFQFSKVVLASVTYNGGMFPPMKSFINHLTERNFRYRTVGFMENGSWALTATKAMQKLLEECKDLNYCENTVKIMSALNDESRAQIEALAEELVNN